MTAEGRISAAIIGIMPPALGLFMWVVNREYISVLFSNQMGQIMAVGAGLWAAFGFWWMRKTIAIEV